MSKTSISMQASRCPDATVRMRQIIRMFTGQKDFSVLELESIEPSLSRSLPAFVSAEGFTITVHQADGRPISEEDKQLWSANFDEDDYSDVSVVNRFVLTQTTQEEVK